VAEGQESSDPVAAKTPRPCDFVAVFLTLIQANDD
jgi:hypothetical protein